MHVKPQHFVHSLPRPVNSIIKISKPKDMVKSIDTSLQCQFLPLAQNLGGKLKFHLSLEMLVPLSDFVLMRRKMSANKEKACFAHS